MHADGSDELARRNWETVTHIDRDVTERAACQGECACAQMRIRLGAGLENLMDEVIEILTVTRPQKSQPSNTWDHWPSWEEESVRKNLEGGRWDGRLGELDFAEVANVAVAAVWLARQLGDNPDGRADHPRSGRGRLGRDTRTASSTSSERRREACEGW